jgi:hypothetical protein
VTIGTAGTPSSSIGNVEATDGGVAQKPGTRQP